MNAPGYTASRIKRTRATKAEVENRRREVVMKDASGKVRYSPIIEFTSKEVRNRFSASVIEAVQAAHPEALASDGGAQ